MKPASPRLVFALLLSLAFTLATSAHLRALSRPEAASTEGAFTKLLGDGRRLFAGQAFEMADVYFHAGFYPSIFDRTDSNAPKAVSGKTSEPDEHDHEAHGSQDGHSESEHEKAMSFMGPPRDWLDSFIRRFRITKHTELEGGEEREILPWLKLAIELDPQAIDTYTTTAYWLRRDLGKVTEAEAVLREGIRNNPNNDELLFEMGRLYREAYHDPVRTRNIWILAWKRWSAQTDEVKAKSLLAGDRIVVNLGRLEAADGNLQQAIQYLELAKVMSPSPEAIQKQIDEIQAKLGGPTNSAPIHGPIR